MKKLILSAVVVAAGLVAASAQGTVKFYNITAAYAVSTNGNFNSGTGTGYGTTTGAIGTTAVAGADAYYFALLVDPTAPTSGNPLTGGWSDALVNGTTTPIIGNNTIVAGGLSGTGATGGVAVNNWAAGTTEYVEVVGWSASLGTTWAAIQNELTAGVWNANGYYGVSSFGSLASGGIGGPPVSGPTVIFAPAGAITTGWDLSGVTSVPEPTTIGLGLMGAASLLALRRKKA